MSGPYLIAQLLEQLIELPATYCQWHGAGFTLIHSIPMAGKKEQLVSSAEYAGKPSPSGASDEKFQFVSEGTTHEVSSFGATTWFAALPLDGGKGTITDIFSRFLY
jgi:hypothetical protein